MQCFTANRMHNKWCAMVQLLICTETKTEAIFILNTGKRIYFTNAKLLQNVLPCQGTETGNTEFQEKYPYSSTKQQLVHVKMLMSLKKHYQLIGNWICCTFFCSKQIFQGTAFYNYSFFQNKIIRTVKKPLTT